MATQQVLFSETIAGMKKAFKRKAYESDSDSEIEHYGNRGHKLKKRARFSRKGQLVPATGPSSYKEAIEYAGVRRAIIQRNPPIFDDEGDEVDTEEDDPRVEDAVASAADLNPYANIHIERILSPLIASTDLPTHATLSKPFTSKTLTELIRQSCGIMRKENQSLWQVRHLWTSLCGDNTWVPCSNLVGPNDIELYTEDHVARHLLSLSRADGATAASPRIMNGEATAEDREGENGDAGALNRAADSAPGSKDDADVPMGEAESTLDTTKQSKRNEQPGGKHDEGNDTHEQNQNERHNSLKEQNGDTSKGQDDQPMVDGDSLAKSPGGNKEAAEKPGLNLPQDNAKDSQSDAVKPYNAPSVTTAGSLEEPFIHPMFVAPAGSKPDRDLGLPEYEAEDMRRLLALYVQKQEEICRGAKKLHQGLLRAERLRKEVLHWSKAEAHCGPNRDMSDGEDWYDKEEWGLTEDLKKGQDEEEEDTQTAGKKTRNRR